MKMKRLLLLLGILLLSSLSLTTAQNKSLEWKEIASGVWRTEAGHPESYNLLTGLDIRPRTDAVNRMEKAELPFDKQEIQITQIDGKTYIRFPLTKDEKIYGLGLNFKTVEQQGRILRLHVDHYGGADNGRTHAPVPFFVSSRGYGAFINSARYIDCWIGTSVRTDDKNPPQARDRNTDSKWDAQPRSENMEFLVPAEGVELTVYSGKNILDVVRRFNLMNGGGVLPPKWGLGFWHRVPSLYSDKQVEEEVGQFEQRGFPLSVIGLEPGWMSRSYPCTYVWDSTRYPNPQTFVKYLNDRYIKTNLWMNPYIAPNTELSKALEPYVASHKVWNGTVPDYSMPEVKKLISTHLETNEVNIGVSGFKMDENDGFDNWLWPDAATFPSGHSAEQMRQTYGMLMQKMMADIYRQRNIRTYGLVRAGNAGMSSFPFVLYNDYYNHRDYITALINSSFIGVLWTPEVRSSATAEEWLRRMQTVCFAPIAMLDAWSDGTKPWTFPEVAKDVQDIARLRIQLIPYFYTSFADYAFEGISFVRAMNLEDGFMQEATVEKGTLDGTANPYALSTRKEMKDQYMVGPSLLVAPLFQGETKRTVVLPKGKWYDFFTGKYVGSGETITVEPGNGIPVYVKDGAIIPMMPAVTKLTGEKLPIEVRHYGEKGGTYSLYDDDGTTYNYEKGEYGRVQLNVVVKNGKKKLSVTMPKGKKLWSYTTFTLKKM
jgi:alpha-D-xyloside xylohydrolase